MSKAKAETADAPETMTAHAPVPEAAPEAAPEAEAAAAEAVTKQADTDAAAGAIEPNEADTLEALLVVIEVGLRDAPLSALIGALQEDHGATIRDTGTVHEVKIHGITVTSTAGPSNALRQWCDRARRQIMRLRAGVQ